MPPETAVRDCFISHASEDKDAVARPLAHALTEAGYRVWFDEFEIELGDSLRGKIDEGLATSRFGVVVLSRRFFEKNWTKVELDALVSRQTIGSERVILPIWHEIDEEYLASVSPTLASLVGVPSSPLAGAVEKIAKKIDRRRDAGSSGGALVAAQASQSAPPESDPERLVKRDERVRLGYSEDERTAFNAQGGSTGGPGWLSVVVGPARLQEALIDPVEISVERFQDLTIEDPWYPHPLLNRQGLRASLDGFHSRFPEEKEGLPQYGLKICEDGLMEFGMALTGLEDERTLAYITIAEQIHDYALLFARVLEEVGYRGDAVAMATLGNAWGFTLALPPGVHFEHRPIDVDRVRGRPLRAPVGEMPVEVKRWTKKTMDRFFLATGISQGAFFITEDGLLPDYR